MSNKSVNLQKARNLKRFEMNYNRYKSIALDMFRWENLPDGMESRYIEEQLFENGKCFLFKDKALGYVSLPVYDNLEMDIYGDSVGGIVRSYNGLIEQIVNYKKDGVRCLANDMGFSLKLYIMDFANRMTDVENAIMQNVKQQKFPFMYLCNKSNELSFKVMNNKIEKGEGAIFLSDTIDIDSMKIANTTAPYVVDKLNAYRYELERELLTVQGINNTYEKTERLLTSEVESNNDYILRNLENQYKQRLEACEKFNVMYGENITVRKTSDILREQYALQNNEENEENEENGENEVYENEKSDTIESEGLMNKLKKLLGGDKK